MWCHQRIPHWFPFSQYPSFNSIAEPLSQQVDIIVAPVLTSFRLSPASQSPGNPSILPQLNTSLLWPHCCAEEGIFLWKGLNKNLNLHELDQSPVTSLMAGRNWTNSPVQGSMDSHFLWTHLDWFKCHQTWSDVSRIQGQRTYFTTLIKVSLTFYSASCIFWWLKNNTYKDIQAVHLVWYCIWLWSVCSCKPYKT